MDFVILLLIGMKIASDLFSHVHCHRLTRTKQIPDGMLQH